MPTIPKRVPKRVLASSTTRQGRSGANTAKGRTESIEHTTRISSSLHEKERGMGN